MTDRPAPGLRGPETIFAEGRDLPALRGLPGVEEPLARMLYLVEQHRPFGLVSGPENLAHRDLLELARGELQSAAHPAVLLETDALDPARLSWTLACQRGLAPAASSLREESLWRRVEDHLRGCQFSGRRPVLLLDRPDLSSAGSSGVHRLVGWAVSGRFVTVLASAATPVRGPLKDLLHRCADVRIELQPLSVAELASYLQRAGTLSRIPGFSESAIAAVHEHTDGMLCAVRRLCRLAVLAAELEGHTVIDAALIRQVASELPVSRPPRSSHPELVS